LTLHTNITIDTITGNHRGTTRWAGNINIRKRNTRANSIRRASEVSNDLSILARRGAINVLEFDIGEVHSGRVLGTNGAVDVEIALVQHDRSIGVLNMDVLVGDVVEASAILYTS